MRRYIILLFAGILILNSCKTSHKASTQANTRYQRKPIQERTQASLEIETLLIDATMQREVGNTLQARQKYSQILKKDSTYAPANYGMSLLLASEGKLDSASTFILQAIRKEPQNVWYKLSLCEIDRATNNTKRLIETWESIVKLFPDKIEYYFELSNAYILDNNLRKAISTLDRAEKVIGITEDVSRQKQKLWMALGREDQAVQEMERLVKAMPQNKRLNAILAEMYMSKKDYPKAKQYYDQYLAADPTDEFVHISLANYYKQTNQPEKAYQELRQGFLNPNLDAATKLSVLGSFYTDKEFYGEYSKYAFPLLDIVMKQCPDTTQYALFYADVLMRQQKYFEAEHQFRLALSVDSSEFAVWESLLMCITNQNFDFNDESQIIAFDDKLKSVALRAIELFPFQPLPYYVLSNVEADRENYEEAISHLLMAESVGVENLYLKSQIYAHLGEFYYHLEDINKSFSYFDKYVELKYYTDMYTLNDYAYYLALANQNLPKAENLSKQTINKEPTNPHFLDTYAWILHLMGRKTEAKAFIEEAVKYLPKENPNKGILEHYKIIMEQ